MMDFGSSHVYKYDLSDEEYISDEELKVGMHLRYDLHCTQLPCEIKYNHFNHSDSDSDDSSDYRTAHDDSDDSDDMEHTILAAGNLHYF